MVLNQSDGSERWRGPVTSEVLAAPQTNGDIVVAQTVDSKLIALDVETGQRRWIYETTQPPLTPARYQPAADYQCWYRRCRLQQWHPGGSKRQ